MIPYKLALLPVIPFSLAGLPNVLTCLEIGVFVYFFMVLSIMINNSFLIPIINRLQIKKEISK